MQPDRVSVPSTVMDGILAVRNSGRTNMFHLPEVVRIAVEMDFVDAAMWIDSNRSRYCRGILHGFRATEGGMRPCVGS